MSIKKVSNLDPYLDITGGTQEVFSLPNFNKSLFEISKAKSEPKYVSRKITGDEMVSAMYAGLSNVFADTTVLSAFSKKLAAIVNCFDFDYDQSTQNYTVSSFTLGGTNITNYGATINNLSCTNLSVFNPIYGTARRAMWS